MNLLVIELYVYMARMKHSVRTNSGYALVSVMVLGVFAVIFMLAVAGMIISIMQSETVAKQKSNLLDAAEVGLDYALDNINQSIETGELSQFEILPNNMSLTVPLPSDYLDDSRISVNMRLKKLSSEDALNHLDWGLLAVPQMEPVEANPRFANPIRGGVGNPTNDSAIRVLEVTATANKFSQSVRAVLTPRNDQPIGAATPAGMSSQSLFPNVGIFAVSRLNMRPRTDGGSLSVQSLVDHANPDPGIDPSTGRPSANQRTGNSYSLTVQSNQQATIGKNTSLIGNLKVTNNTISAPNDIANIVDNGTIYGRVDSNSGTNTSLEATNGATEQVTDNVLANSERLLESELSNPRTAPNDVPVNSSIGESPTGVNPAPSTAVQGVDTTGDGIANTNNDLSSFLNEVSTGSKAVMNHGVNPSNGDTDVYQFKTSGIDATTTGNLPIIEVPSSNANPTQIYVDGSNADTAIEIDSSRFKNMSSDPRNLQLFYDGTSDVSINVNGVDFSGLVYAPNARVSINGTGNFNGAIVGDRVNVRLNGQLRLDTALSDDSTSSSSSSIPVPSINYSGGNVGVFGYQASTFQEVRGALVPAPGN